MSDPGQSASKPLSTCGRAVAMPRNLFAAASSLLNSTAIRTAQHSLASQPSHGPRTKTSNPHVDRVVLHIFLHRYTKVFERASIRHIQNHPTRDRAEYQQRLRPPLSLPVPEDSMHNRVL